MALCTPICPQRDTICRGGVGRGLTTIHLTSRQSRMRPQTRKRLIDSLFLFLMILPTYPMPLQSIFFTGQPIFLMAFKNINAIVCVNIVCDVIILRDRNKVATTGLGGNSAWSENFRMIWKVFRRSESSRWSEQCPDDLKSDQMIWKVSRWSEKCPDDLESVQMIWKASGWSEKWINQMVCTVCGWFRKCPSDLENIQIIHKVCFCL